MSEALTRDAGRRAPAPFEFAAFISYTTDPDYRVARSVESFIEAFHTQTRSSGLAIEPLQVCRDGSDFTSTPAGAADGVKATVDRLIATHLEKSRYLVILCSRRTPASRWVGLEVDWFLEHRGADHILLAVTDGAEPAATPGEVFPPAVLSAGVHHKPWYDLRGMRGRAARAWHKVRDPDEELARLAAHLSGDTSGRLVPAWKRDVRQRALRQRLFALVAAVIVAVLAAFAINQAGQSRRAGARASAGDLVLAAEANLPADAQLSLLLALHAVEQLDAARTEHPPGLASLLRRAVLATPMQAIPGRGQIETFAWSPDGTRLAIGDNEGGISLVEWPGGRELAHIADQEWIESLAWTSDGSRLASGSRGGSVVIRDGASLQPIVRLPYEPDVQSVHWSADDARLAIGLALGPDSRADIYDVSASAVIFSVPGIRAAWSPSGDRLATGDVPGVVRVFTSAGQLLHEMGGHDRYVRAIRWNAAGDRIATASVDDRVIVWDAVGGALLRVLDVSFALGVAWSPGGGLLASGSGDEFVTVWDTGTWEIAFSNTGSETLTGEPIEGAAPAGYVQTVEWSPDGRLLAVSDRGPFLGNAGAVLVYPSAVFDVIESEQWVDAARLVVSRELTPEECRQFLSRESCPLRTR